MELKVKKVRREGGLGVELLMPAILQGLAITMRHFFRNVISQKDVVTVEYPEKQRRISPRYRGRHRLLMRDDGFIRCVACYMCESACPANCIHIESGEMEDKTVEKYPVVFDIDELRCVYCGLCVEACPKDAIRMDTGIISLAFTNRVDFDYTRDMLRDAYTPSDKTKFKEVPLPLTEAQALPRSQTIIAE